MYVYVFVSIDISVSYSSLCLVSRYLCIIIIMSLYCLLSLLYPLFMPFYTLLAWLCTYLSLLYVFAL
jgi:hypothetical protein